jgi:Leucine-rich repeat (LRR) protein
VITEIKHLPDSLCSLYNLQVLILPRCITKLPTHMCKLINLRHLDNTRTKLEEMPPQMGKLKNLRKLPIFIVGKNGGYNARELGELLRQLSGKLIISNLEYVHCTKDATEVMLKDKQDLSELELKWKYDHDTDDSEKERNVLEQLCPPKSLESLTIVNYMGTKFPNWLGDPSFRNMVSIVLKGCKYCFFWPPLGQLPYLKKLEIEGFKGEKVGPEFYGNDSSAIEPRFRSLEYLSFGNMQEWQEWVIFEGEVFPCLQELYISNCPKLSGGLPNELPSLTKLVIDTVSSLLLHFLRLRLSRNLYVDGEDTVDKWSLLSIT